MKTVKTSELSGRALDYAVAKAVGGYELIQVPPDADGKNEGVVLAPLNLLSSGYVFPPKGKVSVDFFVRKYSGDWAECGPLLERYCIELFIGEDFYRATRTSTDPRDDTDYPRGYGSNYKDAVCRFVVLYRLGDEVEIPEELSE
ncbi:phage protein NinX family protein [Morganella morganii]|uniref:phage protein NinX family protein n=1 Tax=Morganella morganii TaxID=582 RepID=UPI0031B60F38